MSVAISAATVTNGAASMAARRARDAECRVVVKVYDHAAATVDQMREFAACVGHLYPQPMSGMELVFAKALAFSAVVGLLGGFIKGVTDEYGMFDNRLLAGILYAVLGAVMLPFLILILGGVAAGAMWVLQ